MSETVAFIPARMGSTRFPGKVLAADTGRPLIQHVYESVTRARSLARVVVATDDQRVLSAARAFGAEAVLTRVDHPNGTSRIAEAAALLALNSRTLIVNVQGDEPELDAGAIDAAVAALGAAEDPEQGGAVAGTVASPVVDSSARDTAANPNIVKVVRDQRGLALYFSRAAVPFVRDAGGAGAAPPVLRHVGIYVYRRWFLDRYVGLAPTPLEQAEQLEQLRVLEHGYRIAVAIHPTSHTGIDTPEQYREFVARWRARPA